MFYLFYLSVQDYKKSELFTIYSFILRLNVCYCEPVNLTACNVLEQAQRFVVFVVEVICKVDVMLRLGF